MKLLSPALGCNASRAVGPSASRRSPCLRPPAFSRRAGRLGLLAAVFLTATCFGQVPQPAPPAGRATVYYAMDSSSLTDNRKVNAGVVRRMVNSLVMRATGRPEVGAAWASLVAKTDRVGIKVAASGGAISGTNPAVVDAIVEGLAAAGIPPSNIIVWDRNLADLLAAGYRTDSARYQLRWVDPVKGYDRKSQVSAPVLGRLIWGDSGFGDRAGTRLADVLGTGDQLSSKSCYAKVLSTGVTKVINVPSLSDSFLTGINGALANMTLPNLDNWRRFTKPPAYGDPYLAEIYSDAIIRDKVVLTIMDGLVMQYAGGPAPNPGFLLDHFTLFAGRDPVAIDATAARLIDEARKPAKLPSVLPLTVWLESAETIGIGKQREQDIDLVRVGMEPGR